MECGMALQYCSQHERLFVVVQERWMGFAEEEVNVIEYLYAMLRLPDLEVVETVCDHCARFGSKPPAQRWKKDQMIN